MLSDKEKKELIADAKDPRRRAAFRASRKLQEGRGISGAQFLDFLSEMKKLFPAAQKKDSFSVDRTFRL